jgi:3',5'-cyclic AMP phosphodiesterase CpdA
MLATFAGAALALSCTAQATNPALAALIGTDKFRVLPYLQSPTPSGMTLNWFTTNADTSTIEISGGGLATPISATITPALLPELDYSAQERAISPRPADMLPNNSAFKHTFTATGLAADTLYTYSVTAGTATFTGTFRTAPVTGAARALRLAVLSDSETLVSGRTTFREWSRSTPQTSDSTGRPPVIPGGSTVANRGRDRYLLTETDGYQRNLAAIDDRNPDLVVMPGDLIEGSGNALETHRRWDEFWRHNAGQYDDVLSKRPLVPAIGNNCIFSGSIIEATDNANFPDATLRQQVQINRGVKRAMDQWRAYFDKPAATTSANPAAAQDVYYRQDFGPVTIITLCSVGATEATNDQISGANPFGVAVLPTGTALPINTDTNRAWLNAYPFGDIPDFNIGTSQYAWASQQLADARAAGQIIFVQWHHTPLSRGIHGTNVTSNQSGEAMRIYLPLLEQYRVAGVFCGHSEVAERSFFDLDNDGYGINLWDVGMAGDGLRGVEDAPGFVNGNINTWRSNPANAEGQAWRPNPFSKWTADQSEPETWNGTQLLSGGKHYGFLEVNVAPLAGGRFRVDFQPYHVFPLNAGDANITITGSELRAFNDRVVLEGTADDLRAIGCGPSDVAGPGLSVGFDGELTADDIMVFISWFASNDPRADVAGQGKVTQPDGEFTADDILVFVTRFINSAGC